MEVSRIFDLLDQYENKYRIKDDVLAGKENGEWVKYDLKTYREMADNISYGLMKLGLKKGDKIATISNNRPEWNFLDMGIAQIGGIHVPIYPTISEEDYRYILNHAGVRYLFVAGKELLRKIKHILPGIKNIVDVYTFRKIEGYKQLGDLIELGKKNKAAEKLQEIKASVDKDDVVTLIYTSGTTGFPKGVMLSHDNLLSNVKATYFIFPVDETSRGLSYLPLCHVYERMVNYVLQYKGVSIYYAENMATIVDNIQEIHPHIMTTVPRLLEKVYDKIMAKGRKLPGIRKQIFFWAVNLGLRFEFDKPYRFLYNIQLKLANKLVFSKWRAAFGGEMRVIVSGGAALQPRLAAIYNAAQIPVLEGYGMTESSPVIAVNTFLKGEHKIGTVGPPLKNVEVKISGAGEILVKGPLVMKGYFKEKEMTAEAVVNGWLHTGDVGVLEDGLLKITGRVKEIFKTSMGKYISPVLLENKMKESPFIDQIMVVGENQKFAAALIVPDFEHLQSWCKIKGIGFTTGKEMINHKEVRARYKKEVDCFNKQFGDTEKIRKWALIDHEWTIDSGEITANLKVKRRHIHEKYKDVIAGLFGQTGNH
ncbi:MAG: long-chain fatty acid--CoA ligase [Bacteroidales bacterium]|nr:long-chain fatty acid--CoA ligase [Bacteroidales bacterium]